MARPKRSDDSSSTNQKKLKMKGQAVEPLLKESSTAETSDVYTILRDCKANKIVVPNYQREAEQWTAETKSLFIESVINNLTIPAFFFEIEDSKRSVIDGQQRLSTLRDYHEGKFALCSGNDVNYLPGFSEYYAGKRFKELPEAYQEAFEHHRLTIIILRDLGENRFEIFRRINQGGTPLSAQDLRLAYYGESSKSVWFVRIVGIHDISDNPGSSAPRFIQTAKKWQLDYPWDKDSPEYECWNQWWYEKRDATGQEASEVFLWSYVAAKCEILDDIIENNKRMSELGFSNKGKSLNVNTVLDLACALLRESDTKKASRSDFSFNDVKEYFSFFRSWVYKILGEVATSLSLNKRRKLASLIGVLHQSNLEVSAAENNEEFMEYLRVALDNPRELGKQFNIDHPSSKGRWSGETGSLSQIRALRNIIGRCLANTGDNKRGNSRAARLETTGKSTRRSPKNSSKESLGTSRKQGADSASKSSRASAQKSRR